MSVTRFALSLPAICILAGHEPRYLTIYLLPIMAENIYFALKIQMLFAPPEAVEAIHAGRAGLAYKGQKKAIAIQSARNSIKSCLLMLERALPINAILAKRSLKPSIKLGKTACLPLPA